MDERIITNEKLNEDIDSNIRPNSIDEYIGQTEVKENLNIPLDTTLKTNIPKEYVKKGFSIKWIPTIALGDPNVGEPLAAALIHAKNAQEFDDILNQKIKPAVKPNQKDLNDMAKSLDFMFAAFEQNNQGSAGVPVAFFLDQRTKQPKMLMGVSEQPILDEIFGRL